MTMFQRNCWIRLLQLIKNSPFLSCQTLSITKQGVLPDSLQYYRPASYVKTAEIFVQWWHYTVEFVAKSQNKMLTLTQFCDLNGWFRVHFFDYFFVIEFTRRYSGCWCFKSICNWFFIQNCIQNMKITIYHEIYLDDVGQYYLNMKQLMYLIKISMN